MNEFVWLLKFREVGFTIANCFLGVFFFLFEILFDCGLRLISILG